MACNTKTINTANLVTFGFTTSFDPYNKEVIISIAEETIFQTGGEANISNIEFTVTDPLNEEHTGSINPSASETEVEITGLSGASLFFGNYHVKGVLTEADASTYEIEFDINVCKPDNMTAENYIKGCLDVNVDCGRAVMEIYEKTKMVFNGKLPEKQDINYNGSITYPNNYLAQINNIDYLPYSLDLTDSITGMYQIAMVTTATFDLDCGSKLLIQYRSKVNEDVQCGASMCEISCCFVDSLAIVEKGGSKGAQMEEKIQMASYYYNGAMALWSCGKPNEYFINKVKEILNCDCQCDKAVLIQPRPITYGAKNLIPSCGTSISINENGDYKFHSFVYVIDSTDTKIKVNTVQTSACTKTTYISLDCAEVERCIYDFLSDSDNEDILIQWQTMLGINSCPCNDVDISNSPALVQVNKMSNFATLEDNYFVKNDIINSIVYDDNTLITGGTLSYIKYYDQLIQQQGMLNVAGGNIILPCLVCGENIADLTGYKLNSEAITNCGCIKITSCDITTPRVDFAERYGSAYRFNPQINEPCYTTYSEIIDGEVYTMIKLFYGDTDSSTLLSSIRVVIFKKDSLLNVTFHETRTIIGNNDINLPTMNNTWGNQVSINRPSSVCLDFDEIVNGEPVLYFGTYLDGNICRAVRERTSECDERANWKVYVIQTGGLVYGVKKFIIDENGNRTFMSLNLSTYNLEVLTYNGVGSKNILSNWTTTYIGQKSIGSNSNFNIEIENNLIFTVEHGNISSITYSGSNSIADITNSANYVKSAICNNLAVSSINYNDGVAATASIWMPPYIQKIQVSGEDRYYFGNGHTGGNYLQNISYLRYMVNNGSGVWEFFTEIVVNSNNTTIDGTWNAISSNVNGASQGMIEIEDFGVLSMFSDGFKLFNFITKEQLIITGQGVINGDLVPSSQSMDTQYSYELSNCGTT